MSFRCSADSRSREEDLAGTASTIRSWLLLEHPGPWGRDAFVDARFAIDGLGAELLERCRRAGVRPLLIRRVDRDEVDERPIVFTASSSDPEPWIERTSVGSLDEALSLDLDALGRGERLGLDTHDAPLFLVCTHGRHDACCAERGRPLAFALAQAFPDETWEASHIGGDRFAGNVVALPYGIYFGRVEPADAETVGRAFVEGRLSLQHLRGRSTMPMPAQFADQALRVSLGLDRLDDVALGATRRDGERVASTFRTPMGERIVTIAVERSEPHALTCRADHEDTAPIYRLVEISSG
jgi:hypothetical protein